jgi:hypothetical protein
MSPAKGNRYIRVAAEMYKAVCCRQTNDATSVSARVRCLIVLMVFIWMVFPFEGKAARELETVQNIRRLTPEAMRLSPPLHIRGSRYSACRRRHGRVGHSIKDTDES